MDVKPMSRLSNNNQKGENMNKRMILGVQIANRTATVQQVQHIFTDYGCCIRTRLGLHQVSDNSCSASGLVLLEMYGDLSKADEMAEKLQQIHGVTVKKMVFED